MSSATRLAGKRLTSHEAITNAVPALSGTLADMKLLLDQSLLTGVLHPIIHGFNYSQAAVQDAIPWRWGPEIGTRAPYPVDGSAGSLWIHLDPSESLLLVFEPPEADLPDRAPAPVRPSLPPTEWMAVAAEWAVSFHHGIEDRSFERTLRPLEDLSLSPEPELASFAGTLVYRTIFDVADRPFDRLDLGEANGVTEVKLNGQPPGVRWWGRHTYDVAGVLKPRSNTLEVDVTTVVANYARSLKDNPAAQRWAWWFPPISTGLVGPVKLLKTAR